MRCLERNKKPIWYANRTGETYVTDTNGLKTGEKQQTYGTPQKMRCSISISSGANNIGSQGMAVLNSYGILTSYTHNAVTEDLDCPLKEDGILWYGREPSHIETVTHVVNGQQVTEDVVVMNPHNYVVVRKAESLNHLIYYLKEVDAS